MARGRRGGLCDDASANVMRNPAEPTKPSLHWMREIVIVMGLIALVLTTLNRFGVWPFGD